MVSQLFSRQRFWRKQELSSYYDIVIIGGGVHGLSTAYYLAKFDKDLKVAVMDKSYLGAGASGRNTAIIRANYLTPEGIAFMNASLKLYEQLSGELGLNLLFSQIGRLDIGHTESTLFWLRQRSEYNQLMGVESNLITPDEVKAIVPEIDLREGKPFPIMGALHHPPAGVARHDAVVWGYARGADRNGVELHPFTEVIGITKEGRRVTGVDTSKGRVKAGLVVSATAGWTSTIARMIDIDVPILTYPLQAFVTEPLKPMIDTTISSGELHTYIYQTERGELVIGGGVDHYPTYSHKSTLHMLEELATNAIRLLPQLRGAKVLRQWTGICDMTPDYAPIIGPVDGVDNFMLNCGWGTWGFKAAPISGKTTAELILTGKVPELIEPFDLNRFYEGRLINERAAAIAAAIH
ncbi:MAG: FAD-dependent oxidoreductase [SAR202 cluster bacterium]|nr:FAD-dependent oxidoreductase [SAR202 cluster bacterium]